MNTLNNEVDNSLVSNTFGFLRLPLNFQPYRTKADWVITGVPFDLATSGRSGSRFGPQAIRNASVNLAWEECRWPWNFVLQERINIIDCGDLVYEFGNVQDMSDKLQCHTENLLKSGKKCLTFGGDHYVTLPLLRAHANFFGKMALLHFDAHTDTYDNGGKYDHGTMFYHAPNENLIDPAHSIQIGIRTNYDSNNKFHVIDAVRANDMIVDEIINDIKKVVADLPIYLTFDIDCLDPAFAPGTGTPVCGGLSTDKVLKLIRKLSSLNIVGMDIVEVAPSYDNASITSLAAATIALEMLYIQANK